MRRIISSCVLSCVGILMATNLLAQEVAPKSVWKKSDVGTKELWDMLSEAVGDLDFQKLVDADANVEFSAYSAPKDKAGIKDLLSIQTIPESLAKELFKKGPKDFTFYASKEMSDQEQEEMENKLSDTIKEVIKTAESKLDDRVFFFQLKLLLNMYFGSLLNEPKLFPGLFVTPRQAEGSVGLVAVVPYEGDVDQVLAIVFMRRSQKFTTK